jgi:hypothetical protein
MTGKGIINGHVFNGVWIDDGWMKMIGDVANELVCKRTCPFLFAFSPSLFQFSADVFVSFCLHDLAFVSS